MNKCIINFFLFGIVLSGLMAAKTYAQAPSLSSDLKTVYCGNTFKLTLDNIEKEIFQRNGYYLKFSCSALGSCIQTFVLGGVDNIEDLANGQIKVTKSYAPSIAGFTCAGTPNISLLMDTYGVQLVREDNGFYTNTGNSVTITFNPYGDPAITNCMITEQPPYTANGGTINVTGRTNYLYNAQNLKNGQNLQFSIPYSGLSSIGQYTSQITLPPGFLVADGTANTIKIVGGAIQNLASPIQCQKNIVILNVQFSTNKDSPPETCGPDGHLCNPIELECAENIEFNANGLNLDMPYELKMERTACGLYNGQCTTPSTIVLHTSQQLRSFSVDKSFKIGTQCGGAIEADPGNYTVRLLSGGTEFGKREIKLRERADSCSITDVISPVYTISGGGDSGFKLTGEPNTLYRAYVYNEGDTTPKDLPNITTKADGTAQVTVPNSKLKTGSNPIHVAKVSDTTQTCTDTIIGKDSYDCRNTNLPDACEQCPELNGQQQICTEYEFNGQQLRGCRPDTAGTCEHVEDPPECDISTPELACSSCGQGLECIGGATVVPSCQPDRDNSCGELAVYDIMTGLHGNFGSFEQFLAALRGILIPLGIVLGLVFFLLCGYKFMTSQGQPDKLRDAKECLTSAIIGLLVVTMSVSIMTTLINLAFKVM